MEPPKSIPPQKEDELSLKDLILKIQHWIKYLRRKWILIFLCGFIGGSLGLGYAFLTKSKYTAQLTFALEDSKSSPLAAYAGLASQFGIDLSGGSGSGVFSGDNILEFLRSRLMIQKTLLSPIMTDGKKQSLANFYIDINNLRESWGKNETLNNIQFIPGQDRSSFSLQQDSILNEIYKRIIKNNLIVAKPDKKLSFILVQYTSDNEVFSKAFVERLVKEATEFYVATKTQRSKINVSKLQEKADSIEKLLNTKTYSLAASQDMNLNPARNMAAVNTELVTRDKVLLQTMYIEVVKNLELSKIAMNQETPVIQVIDTPILPLEDEKISKLKGLIIGGFLGGFLILCILIGKMLFKEIMS